MVIMNAKKFDEIVKHNRTVIFNCLKYHSTELKGIRFWEGMLGEDVSFVKMGSKFFDILGCCVIGAVPSLATHGADGYVWLDDETGAVGIETKVASIDSDKIHVGAKNGLIWSSDPTNPDNRAGMASKFSGNFSITMTEETLASKERWTALVCFDNNLNFVIDAWLMEPENIYNEIRQRQQNRSINIKLSRFIEEGFRIPCTIPTVGWEPWTLMQIEDAILNNRKHIGQKKKSKRPRKKSKQLSLKFKE